VEPDGSDAVYKVTQVSDAGAMSGSISLITWSDAISPGLPLLVAGHYTSTLDAGGNPYD